MNERNPGALRIDGTRLKDRHGREVILRGVNLGGDCKLPYPDGGTHRPTDFSDHRSISFIGRPFPLDEADEHFARLARWGFNCLRLLTTWEAVEHAGPGIYDTDYLDYFAEIARRAGDHGFYIFIDFHQDVWSRMSGGSGAPGWTFDTVGLDFTKFQAADAAIVMQAAVDWSNPDPHQSNYPQMIWSSNYQLPANGIMWSLFWLGRRATPDFLIGERNVQDYLQDHYLGAVEQVAMRVRDMPHVVGFDTLNEPGTGWLGLPLSRRVTDPSEPSPLPLKPGPLWTPLDAMAAARGLPVELPILVRDTDGMMTVADHRPCNPRGLSIWKEGLFCPFEQAGIYRLADGELLPMKENAFDRLDGRPLSLSDDCYGPFFHRVAEVIRTQRADWLLFAEMDPYANVKQRPFPEAMPADWINASHWYDVAILYFKTFNPARSRDPLTGELDGDLAGLGARYLRQLAGLSSQSRDRNVPTLIGEFGIPYDLDRGTAYRAWKGSEGDAAIWANHECALGLMYDALDALLIHSTQWNYTASNRNDAWIGDGWNQEDLSIFSVDQIAGPGDPGSGGRAVNGFSRPFVRAAQGHIEAIHFDTATGAFTARVDADPAIAAPTEIYLPARRYPAGVHVEVTGDAEIEKDREARCIRIRARGRGRVGIRIAPG